MCVVLHICFALCFSFCSSTTSDLQQVHTVLCSSFAMPRPECMGVHPDDGGGDCKESKKSKAKTLSYPGGLCPGVNPAFPCYEQRCRSHCLCARLGLLAEHQGPRLHAKQEVPAVAAPSAPGQQPALDVAPAPPVSPAASSQPAASSHLCRLHLCRCLSRPWLRTLRQTPLLLD